MPVVVRDKQGSVVGGLKKEDFQAFDNDKPRAISSFTIVERGAANRNAENGLQPLPFPGAAPQPQAASHRFVVLLFDDLHLSAGDLADSKEAGVKAIDGILPGADLVATISTSGKTNSGLTRDRAKLQASILSLMPQGNYLRESDACPKIGYYQAWEMERVEDTEAFGQAYRQMEACGAESREDPRQIVRMTAMRVLKDGSRDFVETFATINEVVRRMANLPGRRTLILVSPGFPILEPEVSAAESRAIELAAQAGVTIGTLNAHGVYTTSVTAGNDYGNDYSVNALHVAGGALSDLADGTGGTYYHSSNDLDAGFKALSTEPDVVYLLELSVGDVKPDDTYHRLKVKVARDGMQVQARHGYFMPKPDKSRK